MTSITYCYDYLLKEPISIERVRRSVIRLITVKALVIANNHKCCGNNVYRDKIVEVT